MLRIKEEQKNEWVTKIATVSAQDYESDWTDAGSDLANARTGKSKMEAENYGSQAAEDLVETDLSLVLTKMLREQKD